MYVWWKAICKVSGTVQRRTGRIPWVFCCNPSLPKVFLNRKSYNCNTILSFRGYNLIAFQARFLLQSWKMSLSFVVKSSWNIRWWVNHINLLENTGNISLKRNICREIIRASYDFKIWFSSRDFVPCFASMVFVLSVISPTTLWSVMYARCAYLCDNINDVI